MFEEKGDLQILFPKNRKSFKQNPLVSEQVTWELLGKEINPVMSSS